MLLHHYYASSSCATSVSGSVAYPSTVRGSTVTLQPQHSARDWIRALHAGLRFLADAEVDELVAGIEAEKAAADAARRGTAATS